MSAADIVEALGKGLRDFQALPLYGLGVGALYAAGGLFIVLCVVSLGMSYLAYPLAAGFALIGPYAAAGLYEVSRRRERGEAPSVHALWSVIVSRGQMGWMAFVTIFIFMMWMYQVRFWMALLLGLHASFSNLQEFLTLVLTTNEGLLFLAVGNCVGAILSLILFSVTVVSFPLLLDRDDVDFVTAMITSVRAVIASPAPMISWGLVIVVLLILSAAPFFVGMLVALPVLGHTTWHLYRRVVTMPATAVAAA